MAFSLRKLMSTLGTVATLNSALAQERQLTHASHGHVLTNINVWSFDGEWIAYDTRRDDTVFDGTRIERVNTTTGEVQCLFEARDGAACGVVTCHPREPKVVFILGPDHPSPDWTYGASRRRGVIVDTRNPGRFRPLDAMNYAPPFVPGALRGGSHVHVFSPDGAWISFTYEDEVLARLGPDSLDSPHDLNQRNVAVAVPAPSPEGVKVGRSHPRNHDGDAFSVVVTRTVNRPRAGSDEISRAYEEGWVSMSSGRRALAFVGNVTAESGGVVAEVFLAELPDDLTQTVDASAGTDSRRRLTVPAGVSQRRLTYTAARRYPGVAATPRHWLRASPDGSRIAFLMRDDDGIVQLFTVTPEGGAMRQVTRNGRSIASAFTWHPDGGSIAHVVEGRVGVTDVASGQTRLLTDGATGPALPHAVVFSPDGSRVAFMRNVDAAEGTFAQIFTVRVPRR